MDQQPYQYMTATAAAEILGLSPLYVRQLAAGGLLPAQRIGERTGQWTGMNTSDRRALIWLVDPRPESRNWRSYSEAAQALGVERSQIRSLMHKRKLRAVLTGDPRLKLVELESLQALLDERQADENS